MDRNFHDCSMCGQQFLLKSTLERHRAEELPGFVAEAQAKNHAYEVDRKRYRMMHPHASRVQA